MVKRRGTCLKIYLGVGITPNIFLKIHQDNQLSMWRVLVKTNSMGAIKP